MTAEQLDRLVEMAEDECGMGAGAWDTIDPRWIARAFIACIPRIEAEISSEMHRASPASPDPLDCPNCGASFRCCDCETEEAR